MKCENCKSYLMIDSGYGHCNRFPPLNKMELKRKGLFLIPKYEIEYTIVPWDQISCGWFKPKSAMQK